MYKIRKEYALFKDIKVKIDKSYYRGSYKGMAVIALQFAALRAAPPSLSSVTVWSSPRRSVWLCSATAAIGSSWRGRCPVASKRPLLLASVLGHFRGSFVHQVGLGTSPFIGADVSSLASEKRGFVIIIVMALLLLVYPIIVAIVVPIIVKTYM